MKELLCADSNQYVVIDSSSNVGGIETLIVRVVSYLLKNGLSVSLLFLNSNSYVNRVLTESKGVTRTHFSIPYGLPYLSVNEGKGISERLNNCFSAESTLVLSSNLSHLQLILHLNRSDVTVLNGFFHTESWVNELFVMHEKILPRKRNSLWSYQRALLADLDYGAANWFMSDVVKKYHEFYYDVELSNSRVIPLPFDIPEIDAVGFDNARKKRDMLKVLWLGRFEYFKNPSIKKTYEALEQLIEKHKDLKLEFDLIGYGSEKYEKDIRKVVKTSGRLQVKYLGKIFPDKLPEVITQYDVGVAMGTSALHIGGMRIPSILVDASDEKHINQIKGCWLHEAPVGFLGEGVYADICGYTVEARRGLLTFFEELLDLGTRSETIGNKCYEYTLENYDENKIMPQIIDAWTSSTFSPGDMEVFRHSPLKRFIRRTAKKILRR